MRFRWKTWGGLMGISVMLTALFALSPAPAAAATIDVATLAQLTQALTDAADGDTIRLTANIELTNAYNFALAVNTLTVDTNGKQLTLVSGGTNPTQSGAGTLTFVDSASPNTKTNLAFSGFASVAGTVAVQTNTGVVRTIMSTTDVTNIANAGKLELTQNGAIWNTAGNVNAGQAAGTTGDLKYTGTASAGVKATAGTISLGSLGTGNLTLDYASLSADRIELGVDGGTGNITLTHSGKFDFNRDGNTIGYTDTNGNSGLYVAVLATGTGLANISLDASVMLVGNGEGTNGVFEWNTATTTLKVQNGAFLNFQNGLTADFIAGGLQQGVSLDNASYLWVGTQATPGVVDIVAETKFTTSTAATFDVKKGSVLYSTGAMTLESTAGGSFIFNVDGTDTASNSASYFGTFDNLTITGAGDATINVGNRGSFSAGKDFLLDVTGNMDITVTGLGGIEVGNDATFTTTAGSTLNLNLSGKDVISGKTYGSYISVTNNLNITGDGATFINLSDGGQIYATKEFNLSLLGSTSANPEIVIKDLYSYISAGTSNLTTAGTSYIDISNGGVFYTDGNATLNLSGAGAAWYLNVSGSVTVDSTVNASAFETGGDLKIQGTGDAKIKLSDGGAINVGGAMTIDVDGENTIDITGGAQMTVEGKLDMTLNGSDADHPEISVSGEGSYLKTGGADIKTAGDAYIKIDDLGGFYSGGATTFTATGPDGNFTFNISGSKTVDDTTSASGFETYGATTFAGDGNYTVNLNDGGYMRVGDSTTTANLLLTTTGLTTFNVDADSFLVVMGKVDASAGSLLLNVNEKGYAGFNGDFVVGNDTSSIIVDGEGASMIVGGKLTLGTTGAATLQVSGGGFLQTGSASLGATDGGTTEANVYGTDDTDNQTASTWLGNGDLIVGDVSNATLNVYDGGYVGYDTSSGSTAKLNLIIGNTATADNSVVNVSKADADTYGVLQFTSATIGAAGNGTLNIFTLGEVYGGTLTLGGDSGSHGTVNVSGADAILSLSGAAVIGSNGTGTVNLEDGGRIEGTTLTLGDKKSGVGTLTLTGEDTVAYFSGAAVVGNLGTGTIELNGETVMQVASMTLGKGASNNNTATGTVNITGAELWISDSSAYGDLVIGDYGKGYMNIASTLLANGKVDEKGIVYAAAITLGKDSGTGDLTVNSKGEVVASGLLTVGSSGSGTVTISGGGKVTAAAAVVGVNKKSTGNVISVSGKDTELILTKTSAEITLGAGNGTLTVSDQAKMTIQADSIFAMNGNATIDNAELKMESTFTSTASTFSYMYLGDKNTLSVINSGKLTGNGWVEMRSSTDASDAGKVVIKNGGIISPGDASAKTAANKYGYLAISGDLDIINGGIYAVDLGASGSCDLLEVSGFTNLEGGIIRVNIIENITDDTEWVILSSMANDSDDEDGITGEWTLDTGNLPAFVSIQEKVKDGTKGTEDHNTLTLMVKRVEFFGGMGSDPNSIAVGEALDKVPLSQWYKTLEALAGGTEAEINDAMHQMSGAIHGNASFLARQQMWFPIGDRISWTPDCRAYLGPQNPFQIGLKNNSAVWLATGYNYTRVDSSNGLDGFRTDGFNIYVGLDTIFEENFAGGVFVGFGSPKMKQYNDRAEADNLTAGVHAGYKFMGGFEVKGMFAYTYHTINTDRHMSFFTGDSYRAKAKYNGSSLTASVEFARPYYFGNFVLRPLFAIDMEYVWMEEVIEHGAGLYNLHYDKSNSAWTFARLGANFDITPWERFNLKGRLFYSVQMDRPDTSFDASFANSGANMHILGTDPGRHFFNAGVTANYNMGALQRVSLFANYDMYVGGHSNSHMVGFGSQVVY